MTLKAAPIAGKQGIDVSSENGAVDWARVARETAISFASIRTSCGLAPDAMFQRNRAGLHAVGIPGIFYFPLLPGRSIAQQVQVAISQIGSLDIADLQPCIDWELHGVTLADVKAARTLLEGTLLRRPLIYSYPAFIEEQKIPDGDSILECDLWISHTGVGCPRIPSPWKSAIAWQWCGDDLAGGPVPGVASSPRVDGDVFLGDFEAWRRSGDLRQMPPVLTQASGPASPLRVETDDQGIPTPAATPAAKSSQRMAAVRAPIIEEAAPDTRRSS